MTAEDLGAPQATAEDDPQVTVVVPLYNGAAYIAETLTSIQRQSIDRIEVIVVDDGSGDDGPSLARSHPLRPIVVEQLHLGVAVARNRGLALARGRWVTFLDQDDLWHPRHLERAVEWLDAHRDDRVVVLKEIPFTVEDEAGRLAAMDELAGGWAQLIVSRNRTYQDLVDNAVVEGTSGVERLGLRTLLAGPVSVTTSFVADPMLLKLAGGFAPHALAMDDYWLLVNVARISDVVRLDQPTVFYRVHIGATSRTTRLGLPFLSSAVALRLGGGLIDRAAVSKDALLGELHLHLLRELIASPEYSERLFRSSVDNLARLLWPIRGRWGERVRARVARRLPGLRRAVRAARNRRRA